MTSPVLAIENLVVRYPDAERPTLDGLNLTLAAGDRLALNLEPDGLHLAPQGAANAATAHALIGAAHYEGEPVPLERMDPALYVSKRTP
jgi:ABC-type protease/lipase transport system fused ATPase/permease subunit